MTVALKITTAMKSPLIEYNEDSQAHEAHCPDGYLKTFFILPHDLRAGFEVPPLYAYFYNVKEPFIFYGRYNHVGENMEFAFGGPEHFQYKVSICVRQHGDEYAWRVSRRGVTRGSSRLSFDPRINADVIFVPKEVCINQDTIMPSDIVLPTSWALGGGTSLPSRAYLLNLEVMVLRKRGSCSQLPIGKPKEEQSQVGWAKMSTPNVQARFGSCEHSQGEDDSVNFNELPAGPQRATAHARTSWSRQLANSIKGTKNLPKKAYTPSEDSSSDKQEPISVGPELSMTHGKKASKGAPQRGGQKNSMSERRRGMTSLSAILKEINEVREAAGQQKKNINYDEVEYRHHVSEIRQIGPEEKKKGTEGKTDVSSSKEKKLNKTKLRFPKGVAAFKSNDNAEISPKGAEAKKNSKSKLSEPAKLDIQEIEKQSFVSKLDDTFRSKLGNVFKKKKQRTMPADIATAVNLPKEEVLSFCTPIKLTDASVDQGGCRLFRVEEKVLPSSPNENARNESLVKLQDNSKNKKMVDSDENEKSDAWETFDDTDLPLKVKPVASSKNRQGGNKKKQKKSEKARCSPTDIGQQPELRGRSRSQTNNNKALDKSKEKYPSVSEVISAFDKQRPVAGDHSIHLKPSGTDNQKTLDRLKISHWQRKNEYLNAAAKSLPPQSEDHSGSLKQDSWNPVPGPNLSADNCLHGSPKAETHPINAAKERDNITFQGDNHDETHRQDTYYKSISRHESTMRPAKWDMYKKQRGSSNVTARNTSKRLNGENVKPDVVPTKELLEMKIEWRDKDNVKNKEEDYVSTIVQLIE